MKSNLDLIITLILFIGYSYTQITAHVLLAGIDKKSKIPRHKSGEIRLKDITLLSLTEVNVCELELRKAMFLLKVNNYIIHVFFASLAYSLFFEITTRLNYLSIFAQISKP
jgi:hypothetical protein